MIVPKLDVEAYAADDAKSAAQLVAAGHLHKENDDRFDAITQALEREADYKPGSVKASVSEGAKPGFLVQMLLLNRKCCPPGMSHACVCMYE